jgi:hypothetical protein
VKVGTFCITAVKYGSTLNHVRGRPASAIIDQVSAFVENKSFCERPDIGSADGEQCEFGVQDALRSHSNLSNAQ